MFLIYSLSCKNNNQVRSPFPFPSCRPRKHNWAKIASSISSSSNNIPPSWRPISCVGFAVARWNPHLRNPLRPQLHKDFHGIWSERPRSCTNTQQHHERSIGVPNFLVSVVLLSASANQGSCFALLQVAIKLMYFCPNARLDAAFFRCLVVCLVI